MRASNFFVRWLIGVSAVVGTGGANAAPQAPAVAKVPLGGSLPNRTGDLSYAVYVPTRFGGVLTIKAGDGAVKDLTGPGGRAQENGAEIGDNHQGWYSFRVVGAKAGYTVETTFQQVAQSPKQPWNFYYWPTKTDCIHEPWDQYNNRVDTYQVLGDDVLIASPGSYVAPGADIVLAGANGLLETPVAAGDASTWFPNLSDDLEWTDAKGQRFWTPSPLLKYDQIYGSSARAWEAANTQNNKISRWPGHCLGGAVASILLNDPIPDPRSGLTKDELKALWAELGENHLNHKIGDFATDIPYGPPMPGWDACDRFAPRVHSMFERHIRGQKQILLANMRAFPPRGTSDEVWNQGVGKYIAKYHAVPGRNELVVRIDMEIYANSGSCINGQDDKPRVVNYSYVIPYNVNGDVDENRAGEADWLSVSGEALYAPLNVLEVVQSWWQGHNPYVTEANVRALDLANGGGGAKTRFLAAGGPPKFMSVAQYEAGRPSFFGNGGMQRRGMFGMGQPDAANAQPRRGLFRFLGNR